MSVQRFSAYHSGDLHKIGLWDDPEGYWVTYADHTRIVAELEQAHAECICHHQNAAHYIGGELQSFHIDGVEFISEQAHAAALAEANNNRIHVGTLYGYEAGLADSKPRILTADGPEPAIGSVVLDATGAAWQKVTRVLWARVDSETNRYWEWIIGFGPVTLIWNGDTDAPVR